MKVSGTLSRRDVARQAAVIPPVGHGLRNRIGVARVVHHYDQGVAARSFSCP